MTTEGLPSVYHVELLTRERPVISKRDLLEALKRRCPDIVPLGEEDSGPLSFFHTDHTVEYSDGAVPAQTFVAVAEKPLDLGELENALQQSWKFAYARERVNHCTWPTLVTDLMARGLDHRVRLALFQAAVLSLLDVVTCEAIHWAPAQQIVDPVEFGETLENKDLPQLLSGALNVRFFNVANRDDEMLMDTVGLAILGLPDLQCHFRNLDTSAVARVLYNTAVYVFDNGDVIDDGHTVAGIDRADKWRCQHEDALVSPDRVVLDLNPGAPYAAGNRVRG